MASLALRASQSSCKPLTTREIYAPMVATASAVLSTTCAIVAKFVCDSNPWAAAFSVTAALPGLIYGKRVYTDWIPKMVWSMPKGEFLRWATGSPRNDKRWGLEGWQANSTHSNHFDQDLAVALTGLCSTADSFIAANYDCGGRGQYLEEFRKAGVPAVQFDFSAASVRGNEETIHLASLSDGPSQTKYDLVTSFEVMSKTKPGEEEAFAQKLIDATKPGGMIVMSCAIPDQPGPNCNCHTNEEVIALFKKHGCRFDPEATLALRRAANDMHYWLKKTLLVFRTEPPFPWRNSAIGDKKMARFGDR